TPLINRLPPPGITVDPLPFIVPPVQVITPLTLNTPLPASAPPFKVALIVLAGPLKLAAPPLITALPTLQLPLISPFAPVKLTVPAAVTVELISSVIPSAPKLNVAPAPALKLPWLSPLLIRFTVPLCTSSVPLLLTCTCRVLVPLPPLFFIVPVLFTTGG